MIQRHVINDHADTVIIKQIIEGYLHIVELIIKGNASFCISLVTENSPIQTPNDNYIPIHKSDVYDYVTFIVNFVPIKWSDYHILHINLHVSKIINKIEGI